MNDENNEQYFEIFEKEKALFEERVWQAIAKSKLEDSIIINNITLTVKIEKDGKYSVFFGKNEIFKIDAENETFEYNIENIKGLKKNAEENLTPDIIDTMGLPSIEYLEYLDKDNEEQIANDNEVIDADEEVIDEQENEEGKKKEKEEEEKDNKKDSNVIKNASDEIPNSNNVKMTKATMAQELGVAEDDIYEIELHRNKVAGDKTLAQVLNLEDYNGLYAVRTGESSWELKAINNNGELEKIGEKIENVSHRSGLEIEGDNNTLEETAIATEFRIGDYTIAIQKNEQDGPYPQFLLGRRVPDNGINSDNRIIYTKLAQPTLDRTQEDPEERETMGAKYTSPRDLMETMDSLEIIDEIPDENGIQLKEINDGTNKEELVKKLKDAIGGNFDFPGQEEYIDYKAKLLAERILNREITWDEAINEMRGNKEQGGRTPFEERKRE